jgi:hypothetical protein
MSVQYTVYCSDACHLEHERRRGREKERRRAERKRAEREVAEAA